MTYLLKVLWGITGLFLEFYEVIMYANYSNSIFTDKISYGMSQYNVEQPGHIFSKFFTLPSLSIIFIFKR